MVKVCYSFLFFVFEAGVHESEGDLRRAGASGLPAGSWDDLTYSRTCLGSDHSVEPLHCTAAAALCVCSLGQRSSGVGGQAGIREIECRRGAGDVLNYSRKGKEEVE